METDILSLLDRRTQLRFKYKNNEEFYERSGAKVRALDKSAMSVEEFGEKLDALLLETMEELEKEENGN